MHYGTKNILHYFSLFSSIFLKGDMSMATELRLLACIVLVLEFDSIEKEFHQKQQDVLGIKDPCVTPDDEKLQAVLRRTSTIGQHGWACNYDIYALSRVLKASVDVLCPSPYGIDDKTALMSNGIFGRAADESRKIRLIFYSSDFFNYKPGTMEKGKLCELYKAVHFAPLFPQTEKVLPEDKQKNSKHT